MALMENGKIAILGTAREAFTIVWASRGAHIALSYIALLPFTIMASAGLLKPIFQSLQTLSQNSNLTVLPPGFWTSFCLYLTLVWGWGTACAIFWLRLYLTGSNHFLQMTPRQLFTVWLKMIGYFVGLLLVIVLAATSVSALVSSLLTPLRSSGGAGQVIGTALAVCVVAALIVFLVTLVLRLTLTFISFTVGEDMPFRQSWVRMREHSLSLFLTLMLVTIPVEIVSELSSEAVVTLLQGGQFGNHGGPLAATTYLGLLILSPLTFAPTALQLAVAAIYYWHLRPNPEHQLDIEA